METNFDAVCLAIIDRDPNMAIPWYLMAAYGYYMDNHSILSDALFDELARRMLGQWDTLHHFHKYMISRDDLEAGTLLHREFPRRVQMAYYTLLTNRTFANERLTS